MASPTTISAKPFTRRARDEALAVIREGLRLKKKYADDHNGVGAAKLTAAQRAEWLEGYVDSLTGLAAVLHAKGELDAAIVELK